MAVPSQISATGAAAWRGRLFESLDHLAVLPGGCGRPEMLEKPNSSRILRDHAPRTDNPKPLIDNARQINTSPTNHAINFATRPGLNYLCRFRHLCVIKQTRAASAPGVGQTVRPQDH